MSVEKHVGHVIDLNGFRLEVWVVDGNMVILYYGGSQQGDFPIDQPGKTELERLAIRVALGEAKILACLGEDAVIDTNDIPDQRNRVYHGQYTVH